MEKSKLKSSLLRNSSILGTFGKLNKSEGGGGSLSLGKLGGAGGGGCGGGAINVVAAAAISSIKRIMNLQDSDVGCFI